MEYTQGMFKIGDWVHTENGIGVITNILPKYYQYWEKEHDDAERLSTWGDDQELANKIFGEIPEVGDWTKDIITMKRLCNHDLKPLTRTMCFTRLAYANDKITKREMAEVRRILKNDKLRKKFENYTCKYEQIRHLWGIYIAPRKAVQIKNALDDLKGNESASLRMTMQEIETYFKDFFDVDVLHGKDDCKYNNATIHTLTLPENSPEYYNTNKEQIFCKILISKQWYDPDYFAKVIEVQKLNSSYYDKGTWEECGWNGDEIQL